MVTRCNQCDSTFLMLLYGQLAKGAATSQKLGVSVFSVPENAQLQRSKASRGSRGMWRGGYLFTRHQSHPSPADYRGSGECRKLRERSVTGTEPQPQKRFWGVSCAVLCDFTHHLGRFTAAWWEILYIPLLDGSPSWVWCSALTVWGVPTPTVAAAAVVLVVSEVPPSGELTRHSAAQRYPRHQSPHSLVACSVEPELTESRNSRNLTKV